MSREDAGSARDAIAFHLDAEVAVQLSPAGTHHVGHVEVAEAPLGPFSREGPLARDPGLVTQRGLIGERRDRPWLREVLLLPADAGRVRSEGDL